MKRFKSPDQLLRFASFHASIANLFHLPSHEMKSSDFGEILSHAMDRWLEIAEFNAARSIVSRAVANRKAYL